MIKYIRDEGEESFSIIHYFITFIFLVLRKMRKMKRSIERFVFLRVSFIRLNVEWNSLLKKKGIVILYGAYLVPLIFNSIETL